MQVYEYYLLGNLIKTSNRKYKIYIERINSLYNDLYDAICFYNSAQIDKVEFLATYVIIYFNVIMCLDALLHDNIINMEDKIKYMKEFEKIYNIN